MKFFTMLLVGIVSSSAFAVDDIVSARVTCTDIQASIAELSEVVEPDAATIDELTKLKADYRRSCSRSARGRKSSAGSRVVIQSATVETPVEEEIADKEKSDDSIKIVDDDAIVDEKAEQADTKNVTDEVAQEADVADAVLESTEEVVVEPTEEELLEMELKNLEAGLCADGSKPNKYGCCGDELFKDLGNTVFACCPPDGGDCFPPIK